VGDASPLSKKVGDGVLPRPRPTTPLVRSVTALLRMDRDRLEEYESSCGYDRRLGGCPSNERCRTAVLHSLGTVVTTKLRLLLVSPLVSSLSALQKAYSSRRRNSRDDHQYLDTSTPIRRILYISVPVIAFDLWLFLWLWTGRNNDLQMKRCSCSISIALRILRSLVRH